MKFFNKDPKSPFLEKALRLIIPAGLIWGGIKLWNYIAPSVLTAITNIWWLIALGTPLAMLVGYVALNPKVCWMWYLGLCKKVTGWIIKMDPLSIMDGYLAILRRKYKNLQATMITLKGKQTELQRLIAAKKKDYKEFSDDAVSAQQIGEKTVAATKMNMAMACDTSVKLYQPILDKYNKNITFLDELSDNWGSSIETLAFNIQSKRDEYQTMKAMFRGLQSAEDFISADSAEAQAYGQSLKALEEDVCSKIAYIDDFEQKAKPIMSSIRVEKQTENNQAMAALEGLMRDKNLIMPEYATVPANGQIKDLKYNKDTNSYGL